MKLGNKVLASRSIPAPASDGYPQRTERNPSQANSATRANDPPTNWGGQTVQQPDRGTSHASQSVRQHLADLDPALAAGVRNVADAD
jgi:hypothetical protein